jgi:excinuclease ABC subunit C
VASCIRFNNGRPDKSFYRQFKIKSTKTPNDYKSLGEAVYRRYSGEDPKNLPDLILIDGGKGQLGAVKNLFPNLIFASLAKREERIFFASPSVNKKEGVVLNRLDIVGLLLINIRNHAHRFAVRFHRKLKNSNLN